MRRHRRQAARGSRPTRDVVWGWNTIFGNQLPTTASPTSLLVSANGELDPVPDNQAQAYRDSTLVRCIINWTVSAVVNSGDNFNFFMGLIAWPNLTNLGAPPTFPFAFDGRWDWIWRREFGFQNSGPAAGQQIFFPTVQTDVESKAMRKFGSDLGLILVTDNTFGNENVFVSFDVRYAVKLPW